ncbi:MAG: M42 family peptidase [Oscillospiraceae bacterium]|nr:M42 family peptidase [Oscillospiraceae bacterium]
MAELLKKLSQINAVSGNEQDIRDIILEEIKDIADEVTVDTMGNIIALKKGLNPEKKIAVTANMDEPGLIVSEITDKGYLKFKLVGKIDPRKLVSKKVLVGNSGVKGIIGMKAIHLQTRDERKNVVKPDKLFIDIGETSRETAGKRVKKGDYVTFDTEFETLGNTVKGKALDRSAPCMALIEAFKGEYKNDVYACFLTQHEVGARGAYIVSHRINPDVCLTVWSADTTDMYGCKDDNSGCSVSDGVIISYMDRALIADKNLTDAMTEEAQRHGIRFQKKVLVPFSSDGGAMQTGADGTRILSAAIPCRYSHSPVSIMALGDIAETTEYIRLYLNKIGDIT